MLPTASRMTGLSSNSRTVQARASVSRSPSTSNGLARNWWAMPASLVAVSRSPGAVNTMRVTPGWSRLTVSSSLTPSPARPPVSRTSVTSTSTARSPSLSSAADIDPAKIISQRWRSGCSSRSNAFSIPGSSSTNRMQCRRSDTLSLRRLAST